MQQDEIIFKVIGGLLGFIGTLFLSIISIAIYIWRRHVRENDRDRKENRDDHIRINKRIDDIEI